VEVCEQTVVCGGTTSDGVVYRYGWQGKFSLYAHKEFPALGGRFLAIFSFFSTHRGWHISWILFRMVRLIRATRRLTALRASSCSHGKFSCLNARPQSSQNLMILKKKSEKFSIFFRFARPQTLIQIVKNEKRATRRPTHGSSRRPCTAERVGTSNRIESNNHVTEHATERKNRTKQQSLDTDCDIWRTVKLKEGL